MSNPNALRHHLRHAKAQLTPHSDSPRLDAELLLAHLLSVPRSYLFTHPEQCLSVTQQTAFQQLLTARCQGKPVAYLLGKQEFWSLSLTVTEATLIPRADTECLVEAALNYLGGQDRARILELGTGSGAIACALATERPTWQILATDRSDAALAVAQTNVDALRLSNITLRQHDWFQELDEPPFDLILSNPPYIAADDEHLPQLRHEPITALVASDAGLGDLRHIIFAAAPFLKPGAWLMLEHGYQQQTAVAELFQQAGFTLIHGLHDLNGHTRVTIAKLA